MANEINKIQSFNPASIDKPQTSKAVINDPGVPSFKDTLKTFLTDVNTMQSHADKSIEKMVAGEITTRAYVNVPEVARGTVV